MHRDLKPDNILIDNKTKTLKIIDFGLATEEKISGKCFIIGTRPFIAPEVFK